MSLKEKVTLLESGHARLEDASGRKLPVSMIERMTLVLDAFGGEPQYLSLGEVGNHTQLPRSTVHRILDQLVRLEWVDHTSNGYSLGGRAKNLSENANGDVRLRAVAAPFLHELHMRTGMVVHLAVLDGGDCVYLDKIGGQLAAALPSRVGGRAPAYSTACGKAMLAGLEAEQLDIRYGARLRSRTHRTITDRTMLHQELGRVRQRRGIAFEDGESMDGVACVGAAVSNSEGPVAGISLCGPSRLGLVKRVAPFVVDIAREVSRVMYSDSGCGYPGVDVTSDAVAVNSYSGVS